VLIAIPLLAKEVKAPVFGVTLPIGPGESSTWLIWDVPMTVLKLPANAIGNPINQIQIARPQNNLLSLIFMITPGLSR
jgi:hypothetical protein